MGREVGLGCMRLSTELAGDEARAIAVIDAALDAGVTLLDTADVYAPSEHELGHNERLIARALAGRPDRGRGVRVVTKGGLVRRDGRWSPDGRAKHLRAACEASLRALGVERIDLYLLHAPDPRVPLATSVRALAALKDEGLVGAVGLSNVTVGQLEEARALVEIGAVEVSLGPFAEETVRSGVPERCATHGIPLLAHSPLGGPAKARAIARDPLLVELGERHGVSPAVVALAWLLELGPSFVPIPGATTIDHARALGRAKDVAFDDEDRARLDAAFPFGRLLRTPREARRPKRASAEVVLLMGIQGAGKTASVRAWTERGYARLNRDVERGRMKTLHARLAKLLASGERGVVLDNTYATRALRSEVVETAWAHGAHARCVWLDTPLEEAQVNAVLRMLDRYGRLLGPEELRDLGKKDPNVFGPDAQHRYQRQLEPPHPEEGFDHFEVVPFARRWPDDHQTPAVFVALDGVLRTSKRGDRTPGHPEDVVLDAEIAAHLRAHARAGYTLVGLAWLPEVAAGTLSPDAARACEAETARQLGAPITLLHCPHGGGPATCWCRPPLPGLAVQAIRAHRIDSTRSLLIGRAPADRTFADRLHLRYVDAAKGLAPEREVGDA